jgi:hypothetical protein
VVCRSGTLVKLVVSRSLSYGETRKLLLVYDLLCAGYLMLRTSSSFANHATIIWSPTGEMVRRFSYLHMHSTCTSFLWDCRASSARHSSSTGGHSTSLTLIVIRASNRCCRIWRFSRQNGILTGLLTAVCLAGFAVEVVLCAQILPVPSVAYFSAHTSEVVALFSLGGIGPHLFPSSPAGN